MEIYLTAENLFPTEKKKIVLFKSEEEF